MSDNRLFAALIALILLCGVFGIAVCVHRLPCAEYRAGLIAAPPPTSSCQCRQESRRAMYSALHPSPAGASTTTPEP